MSMSCGRKRSHTVSDIEAIVKKIRRGQEIDPVQVSPERHNMASTTKAGDVRATEKSAPSFNEEKQVSEYVSNSEKAVPSSKITLDTLANMMMGLQQSINGVKSDINVVKSDLVKIEHRIESRVMSKVNDVKVQMDSKIVNIEKQISELNCTVSEMSTHMSQSNEGNNNELKIVIKNLMQATDSEAIEDCVNDLLKNDLDLDLKISRAERLASRNDKYPGIIIASCESVDDKIKVLKAKSKLKTSASHKNVYISAHKPKAERLAEANFRKLVTAIGNENLRLKNGRLVNKTTGNNLADGTRDRDRTGTNSQNSHNDTVPHASGPRKANHQNKSKHNKNNNVNHAGPSGVNNAGHRKPH